MQHGARELKIDHSFIASPPIKIALALIGSFSNYVYRLIFGLSYAIINTS